MKSTVQRRSENAKKELLTKNRVKKKVNVTKKD